MNNQKAKFKALIIHIISFYVIWSLFELLVKNAAFTAVSNEIIAQFIKSGIIKNLVWTLPAICLIYRFGSDLYLNLNELFTNAVNISKYIPVLLAFSAYVILGAYLLKGKIAVNLNYSNFIILLFVGITEETLFRGWFLNATLTKNSQWRPIIINAFMFVLIHFPRWIAHGEFFNVQIFSSMLCVFVLSIIFSWSFIKSRSIIVPIVLHTYWDLLAFLFF